MAFPCAGAGGGSPATRGQGLPPPPPPRRSRPRRQCRRQWGPLASPGWAGLLVLLPLLVAPCSSSPLFPEAAGSSAEPLPGVELVSRES